MWWNSDKIRWYKDASLRSNFHRDLTNLLISHFSKDDEIVELGCGLGFITNRLRELGYNSTGYDIDNSAISFALSSFGPYFEVKDCLETVPQSDVCLAIFFGHFKDLNFLNKVLNSTKKLIVVSNLHSQFKTKKHSNLNSFLKEQNIPFVQKKGLIPFNQPFTSYLDALLFINSYYPKDKEKVIKTLKRTGNNYLLNNNKNFIITIIEGRREK